MFWMLSSASAGPKTCTDFSDAVNWDPDKTRYDKHLKLRASTFAVRHLWDVQPCTKEEGESSTPLPATKAVYSPKGTWRYCEKILPPGLHLSVYSGSKTGVVCFDAPVAFPGLFERKRASETEYQKNPWMSMTPMEIMTMRSGIQKAKGHVIVAGLGMGYLLERVALREQVERITLVEQSQELLDWVLPRLTVGKPMDVICDNAWKVVPGILADVALIDIFPDYGNNTFNVRMKTPDRWVWGAARIGERW